MNKCDIRKKIKVLDEQGCPPGAATYTDEGELIVGRQEAVYCFSREGRYVMGVVVCGCVWLCVVVYCFLREDMYVVCMLGGFGGDVGAFVCMCVCVFVFECVCLHVLVYVCARSQQGGHV